MSDCLICGIFYEHGTCRIIEAYAEVLFSGGADFIWTAGCRYKTEMPKKDEYQTMVNSLFEGMIRTKKDGKAFL